MFLSRDFRSKSVINLNDAEILGYIRDVELNCDTGAVEAIIIPRRYRLFRRLTGNGDYVIPWKNIVRIGKKIVIVDY